MSAVLADSLSEKFFLHFEKFPFEFIISIKHLSFAKDMQSDTDNSGLQILVYTTGSLLWYMSIWRR